MSAFAAIACALWGLWLWTANDLTLTNLSAALLSIAALFAIIAVLEAHYGSTK